MRDRPVAYSICIDGYHEWLPGTFLAWSTAGEIDYQGCGNIYPCVLIAKPDGRVCERTADGIYFLDSHADYDEAPFTTFLWWLHPGAKDLFYTYPPLT